MDKIDITGIYETHLPVADLSRSIEFYRDKIGLKLAYENPDRNLAFFWVGGKDQGMLGLWGSGSSPLHMKLHFAFRTQLVSVLAACNTLKENSVQPLGFSGEMVNEPVVIGWMPAASVYFKDPDGHSIEFISVLNEPPDPDFGVQPYSKWQAR